MARSSKLDPVETYRFEVQLISLSLSPAQIIRGLKNGGLSQFSRAGFTTCTTPESSTTAVEYRENVDNFGFKKIPGLTRFNDIVLSRGVITPSDDNNTSDFYKWISEVSSFNPALAATATLTGTTRNVLLRQSNEFRKDMIIIQRDRNGIAAKRWYLLDVWPKTYKGGSDLDANSQSKSMESLTLTYEIAFELPSALSAATELIANIFEGPATDLLADIL